MGLLLKAIRKKCLDCSCDSYKEVELCFDNTCALYPFRMGKNPFYNVKNKNTYNISNLNRNEITIRNTNELSSEN